MWRRSLPLFALAWACLLATGCWEQLDGGNWFPQMKRQPAVQAFEYTGFPTHPQGFSPPDGAVPVDGGEPEFGRMDLAVLDALVNPRDATDYRSLKNGERLYKIYCELCHGTAGMGDGPVSALARPTPGPFPGVFPLVALVRGRSDGYIYNVIRVGGGGVPGFRMPSYNRIPSRDRWDIVNYVRFLDRQGGQL